MLSYETVKWLHILSSTVLFGVGIGTAFHMLWAMRSQRVDAIYAVASGVVVADWLFTLPAGIIQPITGFWLVHLQGYSWGEPWIHLTLMLYGLAFLCWVPVVVLQIMIREMAADAVASNQPLPKRAHLLFRAWFVLGWPAFTALVVIFWIMVNKAVPFT